VQLLQLSPVPTLVERRAHHGVQSDGNVAAIEGRAHVSWRRRRRVAKDMMFMTHSHILVHMPIETILRPATMLSLPTPTRESRHDNKPIFVV